MAQPKARNVGDDVIRQVIERPNEQELHAAGPRDGLEGARGDAEADASYVVRKNGHRTAASTCVLRVRPTVGGAKCAATIHNSTLAPCLFFHTDRSCRSPSRER